MKGYLFHHDFGCIFSFQRYSKVKEIQPLTIKERIEIHGVLLQLLFTLTQWLSVNFLLRLENTFNQLVEAQLSFENL